MLLPECKINSKQSRGAKKNSLRVSSDEQPLLCYAQLDAGCGPKPAPFIFTDPNSPLSRQPDRSLTALSDRRPHSIINKTVSRPDSQY